MNKKVKKLEEPWMNDPEMIEFLDTLIYADALYDMVVDQIHLPENDEFYRSLVVGILRRQTKDHLVFSIWNNIDEKQSEHLRDFIDQMAVIEPALPHEDVLMKFAMMYPALMAKVHAGMTVFFEEFIARFNGLLEA
jgi:hypothetical protein